MPSTRENVLRQELAVTREKLRASQQDVRALREQVARSRAEVEAVRESVSALQAAVHAHLGALLTSRDTAIQALVTCKRTITRAVAAHATDLSDPEAKP